MKVFFVDPMGYGSLGSYDTSILSNILKKDRHYFCNSKFDLEEQDFPIHKIYSYSDKKGISKAISYLQSQRTLLRKIKIERPEIVHFQWLKIPQVDIRLARRIQNLGSKLVLTVHNTLPHDSGKRYLTINRKIYALFDALIVHTKVTKDELIKEFGVDADKIFVIPHGVLEVPRSAKEVLEKLGAGLRKEYSLEGKVVFSLLGSINKYKGIELLTQAWELLSEEERRNLHLIVAGKGDTSFMEPLTKLSNTTVLNRFLSNDEFLALVQVSDYLLLPYLKISQSGVLLTAMNERKKVIVSDKGGLTEPFQFGNIGFILKELTASHLANTLLAARDNAFVDPAMNVWDDIHKFYSWSTVGSSTADLYQKLLDRS